MKRSLKIPFAAVATVPFVMVLSNSMIIPVLPDLQKALHTSLFRAGLLITAFSIAAALTIPLGGYLSDRYSRKWVIVPSLIIFGLGGGIGAVAPLVTRDPYWLIFAGRVVQGIGGGGTYQVAMALVGDLFKSGERSKALGLLEASNGLGKVISPILGAAVATIAWFAPFFLYPLIAWISAALVWSLVKEPGQVGSRARPLDEYMHSLVKVFDKKGVSILTIFFAGTLPILFLFGVLSLFADTVELQYKLNGVVKGLVIAIPVTVMALTSWLSGTYLQKRIAKIAKAIVAIGLGFVALAFVGMDYLYANPYLFTASISVMGFGNGLVLPALNTMITSSTSTELRGVVTSLYGTVRFTGAAVGPPLFSWLAKAGRAPMDFGSAGLSVIALLAAVFFINQQQVITHMTTGKEKTVPAQDKKQVKILPPPRRSGNRLT